MIWFNLILVIVICGSFLESSSGESSDNELWKKRQQTSLFVDYNVTKTLSYLWKKLDQVGITTYSHYHNSCWYES